MRAIVSEYSPVASFHVDARYSSAAHIQQVGVLQFKAVDASFEVFGKAVSCHFPIVGSSA